jgi:hypothetical protein
VRVIGKYKEEFSIIYMTKVVLCGCTKNSGRYIFEHLTILAELGKQFTEYMIIVYENDSADNTVGRMEDFKRECPSFEYISQQGVASRFAGPHDRVRIIAHGRNTLLDRIREHYAEYDLMIMIDLDGVVRDLKPSYIAKTIQKYLPQEWSALTTNCTGPYYDIWALRVTPSMWDADIHGKIWEQPLTHDCWAEIRDNVLPRACIKSYQRLIPVTLPLIETESSFNGMGVYRIGRILTCKYDPFNYVNGRGHCEHVAFHREIRNLGGKIFICPSLLVTGQAEHIQR